jgi:peptidoglycan/LPS O-acetylase OafA/YrhL
MIARCGRRRSKLRHMRALAVLVLVLALAAPGAALAQNQGGSGDAFGPLPTAPTPTPTAVATVQTSDSAGGDTSRTTLYVIAAGLLVIFLVIGRVIFSDARRHVPAGERDGGTALREAGPHKHEKHAKARARAKGKAQRAARRRNR